MLSASFRFLQIPLAFRAQNLGDFERLRRLALAFGPTFALFGAVAIGDFGLVVPQNLLRWERHVDARRRQCVFDFFQNFILRMQHIGLTRRRDPIADPNVDATARQIDYQSIGGRFF